MKNKIYLKVALYNITIITLIVLSHILLQFYNKKEIADSVLYNAWAIIIIGKFINYGLLTVLIATFVVDYLALRKIIKVWKIILIYLIPSVILYLVLLVLTFKFL